MAVPVGGVGVLRRPAPLPAEPRVLVKASGPDPTAQVEVDAATGRPTGVAQNLSVTTAEQPGVRVEVALAGPGISAAERLAIFRSRSARQPDSLVPGVHGQPGLRDAREHHGGGGRDGRRLRRRMCDVRGPRARCASTARRVIGALALVGGARRCLQVAADRDLAVTRSSAAAGAPGVVAADLDVTVSNTSPRRWLGLRVSLAASPQVVNAGRAADLEPGTTGHLVARVWPDDCADPTPRSPAASRSDPASPPTDLDTGSLPTPTLRLPLPPGAGTAVARALAARVRTEPPRLTVDRARRSGGGRLERRRARHRRHASPRRRAAYVEAEAVGTMRRGPALRVALPGPGARRPGAARPALVAARLRRRAARGPAPPDRDSRRRAAPSLPARAARRRAAPRPQPVCGNDVAAVRELRTTPGSAGPVAG